MSSYLPLFVKNPVYLDINVNSQQSFKKGMLLWFALFLGYMFFCSNWFLLGKLEGDGSSKGWLKDFNLNQNNSLMTEMVAYSILFARGVSTIFAGWIISKLTHRYSVLISLLLTTAAFPLVFAPHYSLLVMGRIVMALGGTLIIIYIQPVISKFFDIKYKGYLSSLNAFSYVFGVLIVRLIFLNSTASDWLITNWKITAGCCAVLTYIPLVIYWAFGDNFLIEAPVGTENTAFIYKKQLLSKEMWNWIICYSFLLVVSVVISDFFPRKIVKNIFPTVFNSFTAWDSLFTITFYVGTSFGLVFIGFLNKFKIKKTPIVLACVTITLVSWLLILFTCIMCKNNCPWYANFLIFSSCFMIGFAGLGVQSVLLYIPHEYKGYTTQSLSIFYSLLWGCGYIVFTFYYIFLCGIFKFQSLQHQSVACLTIFMLLYLFFATKIKEPNPHLPLFPWKQQNSTEEPVPPVTK